MQRFKLFAISCFLVIVVAGCSQESSQGLIKYSLDDVREHNTADSCWMVIEKKIYDVTNYIPYHPGGKGFITSACGIDATEIFNNQNHRSGDTIKEEYLIGELEE